MQVKRRAFAVWSVDRAITVYTSALAFQIGRGRKVEEVCVSLLLYV